MVEPIYRHDQQTAQQPIRISVGSLPTVGSEEPLDRDADRPAALWDGERELEALRKQLLTKAGRTK